jgi:hypothetical protein
MKKAVTGFNEAFGGEIKLIVQPILKQIYKKIFIQV